MITGRPTVVMDQQLTSSINNRHTRSSIARHFVSNNIKFFDTVVCVSVRGRTDPYTSADTRACVAYQLQWAGAPGPALHVT